MMGEQKQTMEECLAYFKERPVYQKLFEKFREKYASLGHLGGAVTLTGLSAEDKIQLGGFFQKDYSENRSVTISAALMKKALEESRFSVLPFEEILEAYFGKSLTAKKEERKQEADKRRLFFEEILQKTGDENGKNWLGKMLFDRGEGYRILMKQYRENEEELRGILLTVLAGIQELPLIKGTKSPGKRTEECRKSCWQFSRREQRQIRTIMMRGRSVTNFSLHF